MILMEGALLDALKAFAIVLGVVSLVEKPLWL
jgi:hypothetical protein